mgnify:CR=1 FL=1
MEEKILAAETKLEEYQAQAADPKIIADPVRYPALCVEMGQAEADVRKMYDRWAELESM